MSIQLGRYEVIEALGEGGMGVVYRALDPQLDRQVAIKVIHPRRLTKESKERFVREARAVARLDSPYIVKIWDIGSQLEGNKELHFIVMEMVTGQTLASIIEGSEHLNRKAMVGRLKLFWQLLKAIQYAHEKGVIHRDLKPENVMVSSEGRVKVMDFGLAVLDEKHSQTRDDQIMGTLAYFAPEQAKNSKAVDHRADIYALGVILFELATGSLPFLGESAIEIIYKLLNEIPAPLSKLNPGLPKGLDKLAQKALKKEPGERYQHISEMLKDLEQVMTDGYQVANIDPDQVPTAPEPAARSKPIEPANPSIMSFKMPVIQMPPPPSLLATSAEIFQRAATQVKKDDPGRTMVDQPKAESVSEVAPAALRDSDPRLEIRPVPLPLNPFSKKVVTASGAPPVASAGWVDQVVESGPGPGLRPSGTSIQERAPVEAVAAEPLGGRRQMCSCGASVSADAKICPECNHRITSSFYLVSREALDLLQRAKNSLLEGDFEDAREAAELALGKDEKLAEAYLCLGKAEVGLKIYEDAYEILMQASELMPESTEPFLALAEMYSAQGDIEGVIKSLQGVLERAPQDVESRCRLAFLYSETARTADAIDQYRKVLKQNPRHVLANRQLGVLLFRTDKTDEALKYLEFAHQTHPDDAQSCLLLGRIYARRRQFPLAEQAFQSAVRLKPDDGTLRAELGALYQAQNRDDAAITELRGALELDGGNRAARLRLAGIYERHGRLDYALRELEEALRYHPQDLAVHRRLGEISLQKRDLNRALEHFQNVVKLDPQCAEMHNQLGRLYLKQNYTEQSIEHYKQALALHRMEPSYYEDLSMAYYCAGNNEAAIDSLRKAATLDSRNPEYIKALGLLFYNTNDDQQAERLLTNYLKMCPNDAQAHGMLGQVMARRGLISMAVQEYSRALEIDPKLHILHLMLARALASIQKHSEAIQSFKNFASHLSGGDESGAGFQAYHEMGESYLKTGQLSRASEVFQMAIKRNPKDALALQGVARVALAKKDFEVARSQLKEALAVEPRNASILETMSELQGLEGNWNEAVTTLQKAIAENPTVWDLHESLGRALRRAGRFPEGAATYRRAAELFPAKAVRFMWLEGRIELRRGRNVEACALLRKALEKGHGDPLISMDLAEALQALGKYDEGLTVIDQALQYANSKQAANLRRVRQLIEEDRLKFGNR